MAVYLFCGDSTLSSLLSSLDTHEDQHIAWLGRDKIEKGMPT